MKKYARGAARVAGRDPNIRSPRQLTPSASPRATREA